MARKVTPPFPRILAQLIATGKLSRVATVSGFSLTILSKPGFISAYSEASGKGLVKWGTITKCLTNWHFVNGTRGSLTWELKPALREGHATLVDALKVLLRSTRPPTGPPPKASKKGKGKKASRDSSSSASSVSESELDESDEAMEEGDEEATSAEAEETAAAPPPAASAGAAAKKGRRGTSTATTTTTTSPKIVCQPEPDPAPAQASAAPPVTQVATPPLVAAPSPPRLPQWDFGFAQDADFEDLMRGGDFSPQGFVLDDFTLRATSEGPLSPSGAATAACTAAGSATPPQCPSVPVPNRPSKLTFTLGAATPARPRAPAPAPQAPAQVQPLEAFWSTMDLDLIPLLSYEGGYDPTAWGLEDDLASLPTVGDMMALEAELAGM